MSYAHLSKDSSSHNTSDAQEEQLSQSTHFENPTSAPISKPPTQHRDPLYSFFFAAILLILVIFSLLTDQEVFSGTVINPKQMGSWESMIMIAPLLGMFLGIGIAMAFLHPAMRENFVRYSLQTSIISKILLCIIFLIFNLHYYPIVIVLLFFAIADWYTYLHIDEQFTATLSLLETIVEVLQCYESSMLFTCLLMVIVHTSLLLWCSVLFISLMAIIQQSKVIFPILLLCFSFLYCFQFCHSLLNAIVSAAVQWIFLSDNDPSQLANPPHHLWLYIRTALTSNLGSVCKGALFVTPCHALQLVIRYLQVYNSRYSFRAMTHTTHTPFFRSLGTSLYYNVIYNPLVYYIHPIVCHYHKLSYGYVTVYGKTFNRAADDIASRLELVDIMLDDVSGYIFHAIYFTTASLITILLTLVAGKAERDELFVFMFFSFFLAYAAVSLTCHVYYVAVDGLILAFADAPDSFAKRNGIIHQKFLRLCEFDVINR